jgi:hypothetical protein
MRGRAGRCNRFLSAYIDDLTYDHEYTHFCLDRLPILSGMADALSGALYQVLAKHSLVDKIGYTVSDNAASAIAACRRLGKPRSPCYAHTSHLIFRDVMEGGMPHLQPLFNMAGRIPHSSHFPWICAEVRDRGEMKTGRPRCTGGLRPGGQGSPGSWRM